MRLNDEFNHENEIEEKIHNALQSIGQDAAQTIVQMTEEVVILRAMFLLHTEWIQTKLNLETFTREEYEKVMAGKQPVWSVRRIAEKVEEYFKGQTTADEIAPRVPGICNRLISKQLTVVSRHNMYSITAYGIGQALDIINAER